MFNFVKKLDDRNKRIGVFIKKDEYVSYHRVINYDKLYILAGDSFQVNIDFSSSFRISSLFKIFHKEERRWRVVSNTILKTNFVLSELHIELVNKKFIIYFITNKGERIDANGVKTLEKGKYKRVI